MAGSGNSSNSESPKSLSPGLAQYLPPSPTQTPSVSMASIDLKGGGEELKAPGADCCFFVMKCSNQKNLDSSQKKCEWTTALANESKLNKAFKV